MTRVSLSTGHFMAGTPLFLRAFWFFPYGGSCARRNRLPAGGRALCSRTDPLRSCRIMTAKASGEIQEDNRRTRVTLWRFPPHGETGFHRHELDYVIVPLTSGPLTIVDKQGQETTAEPTAGVSYLREAGVEHHVIRSEEHTPELQS